MSSTLVEAADLDIDLDVHGPGASDVAEVDPTYYQVWKVTYALNLLLTGLLHADSPETPQEAHQLRRALASELEDLEPREADDNYAETLAEAYEVGKDVVGRDGAKADFASLELATLREVRATVAYVGDHLGIEVDVPEPEACA